MQYASNEISDFRTPIIGEFWNNLERSLDRLEEVMADCSIEELNWRPPAPETNSIYILGVHALGHLRQGILGVLGGGSQERDRDAEFRAVELVRSWGADTGMVVR